MNDFSFLKTELGRVRGTSRLPIGQRWPRHKTWAWLLLLMISHVVVFVSGYGIGQRNVVLTELSASFCASCRTANLHGSQLPSNNTNLSLPVSNHAGSPISEVYQLLTTPSVTAAPPILLSAAAVSSSHPKPVAAQAKLTWGEYATELPKKGEYTLQFASFKGAGEAQTMRQKLSQQGFLAVVVKSHDGRWLRVCAGRFADKLAARAAALRLQPHHGVLLPLEVPYASGR